MTLVSKTNFIGCWGVVHFYIVSSVEKRESFIWKLVPIGFHLLLGKMKLTGRPKHGGTLVVFLYLTLLGSYDRFSFSLLGLWRIFIYRFMKILAICA